MSALHLARAVCTLHLAKLMSAPGPALSSASSLCETGKRVSDILTGVDCSFLTGVWVCHTDWC